MYCLPSKKEKPDYFKIDRESKKSFSPGGEAGYEYEPCQF